MFKRQKFILRTQMIALYGLSKKANIRLAFLDSLQRCAAVTKLKNRVNFTQNALNLTFLHGGCLKRTTPCFAFGTKPQNRASFT